MKFAQRPVVWATAALSAVLLAVALWRSPRTLAEGWYIYRLGSKDELVRVHAAERLGEMASVRAVPALMRAIEADQREDFFATDVMDAETPSTVYLTPMFFSLFRMGPNALPMIAQWQEPATHRMTRTGRFCFVLDALITEDPGECLIESMSYQSMGDAKAPRYSSFNKDPEFDLDDLAEDLFLVE